MGKAHTARVASLDTKWNSAGATRSLTAHCASLRNKLVDIRRCCVHINRAPPTDREMVLKLMSTITTTNPLLTAHISQVNADTIGLGSNFEATAAHLMLADPIETKLATSGRKRVSISSLSGRGGTGVDLRWYTMDEFKKLTSEQKSELGRWRRSEAGQAAIAESLAKFKAEKATGKKRKSSEISGGGTSRGKEKSGGDGEGGNSEGKVYTKKKFQREVKKAAVKIAAAAVEAEKAEIAAADASLEEAIKRRNEKNGASISATSVAASVPVDEEAAAEQEHAKEQTALKLSSVKSSNMVKLSSVKTRITKLQKDVSFEK